MPIVYVHKREDNGQVFYVGIGKNESRAYEKKGRKRNPHWHRVVEKHGYTIEVTHRDISWEEACVIERFLINFWREFLGKESITNITNGGEGVLGLKMSSESKQKMREKKIGNKISSETKIKMSMAKKGIAHTEEAKLNMRKAQTDEVRKRKSEGLKGRPKSAEHIEKVRLRILGKKRSDEFRQKCRERMLGKKLSEEIKDKIRAANPKKEKIIVERKSRGEALKGRVVSDATRKKISMANTGKVRTPEMRQKISEVQKGKVRKAESIEKGAAANKKPILNTLTGIFYNGFQEAADSVPMKVNTLRSKLAGYSINNTPFAYA